VKRAVESVSSLRLPKTPASCTPRPTGAARTRRHMFLDQIDNIISSHSPTDNNNRKTCQNPGYPHVLMLPWHVCRLLRYQLPLLESRSRSITCCHSGLRSSSNSLISEFFIVGLDAGMLSSAATFSAARPRCNKTDLYDIRSGKYQKIATSPNIRTEDKNCVQNPE